MTTTPRTILVTGATRGIGRALVERFVERGHRVHGCGRSADDLATLAAACGGGGHAGSSPGAAFTGHALRAHTFARVDVSDAEAVSDWVGALLAAGEVPDLVVNNAALMNTQAPLWEIAPDEFARLLAVNVAGVHHVLRAVLPAMIAAGRGVIVNLSSGWGRSTSPHVGPYCATKFAVEGLSGSLAQELPPGLACVALSPGVVDTDMLRTCLPDTAKACDGPQAWSHRNAAFFLSLGPEHNGQSLSVA